MVSVSDLTPSKCLFNEQMKVSMNFMYVLFLPFFNFLVVMHQISFLMYLIHGSSIVS